MTEQPTTIQTEPQQLPPSLVAPMPVVLAAPTPTLKLDLACGQSIKAGFEGVDLPGVPGVHHQVNLMRFPWPWADNSILELHCSHFAEHLPMEFVDEHGNYVPCGTPGAKDLFFAFFDECWRILVPDGQMSVIVPTCRSNRGFQDPTHRRFYPAEAFLYLHKGWRDANKLDHYNVKCNFDGPIEPGVFTHKAEQIKLRTDEVQQRIMEEAWNVVADWHARLTAKKVDPKILAAVEAASKP